MTTPIWLAGPLLVLGGMYAVGMPLGVAGEWMYYAWSLILAAGTGLFVSWRYRSEVVDRTEDWVLVRCGRRRSVSRSPSAVD